MDIEEGRPSLRDEVAKPELETIATEIVKRAIPGHPHPDVAAGDLFAMVRGIVDATGERGETIPLTFRPRRPMPSDAARVRQIAETRRVAIAPPYVAGQSTGVTIRGAAGDPVTAAADGRSSSSDRGAAR